MKRISSSTTGFYKVGFPLVWFGFLGLFLLVGLPGAFESTAKRVFLVGPVIMGVFGFFLMKRLVWDLMDEVFDADEFLVIRNRGKEYKLPLADIMNVSASIATNPPRITLRLAKDCELGPAGTDVAFCPERPFSLNPFAKNPTAEDLIVRVDRARRTSETSG
jgi:hypothetical protein